MYGVCNKCQREGHLVGLTKVCPECTKRANMTLLDVILEAVIEHGPAAFYYTVWACFSIGIVCWIFGLAYIVMNNDGSGSSGTQHGLPMTPEKEQIANRLLQRAGQEG